MRRATATLVVLVALTGDGTACPWWGRPCPPPPPVHYPCYPPPGIVYTIRPPPTERRAPPDGQGERQGRVPRPLAWPPVKSQFHVLRGRGDCPVGRDGGRPNPRRGRDLAGQGPDGDVHHPGRPGGLGRSGYR